MAVQLKLVGCLLGCLLIIGCGPEATRERGEPGASRYNVVLGPETNIHGETEPSYDTPFEGLAIKEIAEIAGEEEIEEAVGAEE